jgi:FtsP/CotA-like multicopper oxidase with cupredoxin domain
MDHLMNSILTRKSRALAGLVAVGCAGLLVMLPAASAQPASPIGIVCTSGTTFDLETSTGFISTPDGNSVYMWSFTKSGEDFQLPGPNLCVDQGDRVTVNLSNPVKANGGPGENVSIVFPGQSGVTPSGGTEGLLTREAPPGGSVSYTFVANEPGSYLYQSGTDPEKQIEMGLFGALIVRPSLGADYAYNDPSTQFGTGQEFLILLHEIDPDIHRAVERGRPYDPNVDHPKYWTVNGRSFPDTIADNEAPWLPGQPYGSLVQVQPFDPDTNPHPALIRYANAGLFNHPFHPHGNHLRVIARDGRVLRGPNGEDASFEDFARTIGSGQTYDLLFKWTEVDPWISPDGDPVPVTIPGQQDLVFKDGATFYSGDPKLGLQGELPVDVTSYNECGEFYFPWHSHALFEFTNFDEGFGGMATLLRVDPPGGCQ